MKLSKAAQIDVVSDRLGEDNDCVVKALSLLLDEPYMVVHEQLALRGRKFGFGTKNWTMHDTCRHFGVKLVRDPIYDRIMSRKGSRCTSKTISDWLPAEGRWLLQYSGHVAAFIDGELLDWTKGRNHRINWISYPQPLLKSVLDSPADVMQWMAIREKCLEDES